MEKMTDRICPLLSISSGYKEYCKGDDCAWMGEHEVCAMWAISDSIYNGFDALIHK